MSPYDRSELDAIPAASTASRTPAETTSTVSGTTAGADGRAESNATRAARPKVLLVDDNEAILQRAAVTLAASCEIVGKATDGKSALEAVEALGPEVMVLDISMQGMSGLEVAERLRAAGSKVLIVFLTVHDDEEFVQAALATGAIGYVIKARLTSDLAVAVTEACAGRPFVSHL